MGLGSLRGGGVASEPPLHPDVVAPHGADPQVVDAVLARLEIGGLG